LLPELEQRRALLIARGEPHSGVEHKLHPAHALGAMQGPGLIAGDQLRTKEAP
jgi:hypothetical protein